MMLAKTIPVIAVLAVLVATGVGANSTAWPLAAANGSNVFDVRDFGAAGDGTTLDTEAIAKAIRAAASAGGGTVVFRSGVYRTGTFELLSNVTPGLAGWSGDSRQPEPRGLRPHRGLWFRTDLRRE